MSPNDAAAVWDRGEGEYPSRPPNLRRISATDLSLTMTPTPPRPRAQPGPPATTPASAAEADPACDICRGAGFYVLAVAYGHPDFAKLQRCRCLDAALVAQRRERLAARVAELTGTLHAEMGKLARCRLDALDLKRELIPVIWRGSSYAVADQRRMLARAIGLARNFTPAGEGMYLYGPNGTGKSHIAAAILNACIERGIAARYGTAPALLRLLRQGFSDGSADDRLEALAQVPLLAIDDLGTETASDWAEAALFDLLKGRDNAGLTTIITANIPVEELRDPRIASLIQGNSLIVPLITSDYRALLQQQRAS